MKKTPILTMWLKMVEKEDRNARLRCACGIHQYHWDWRKLCKVCKYCGKRKGA